VKRKISDKQISALKFMIIRAPTSDLLKQILILLIKNSRGMTCDVQITISAGEMFNTEEITSIASDLEGASSLNGHINLGALVHLTGSKLVFCYHNTSTTEVFAYTFWLAKKPYSKKARQVRVSKEILDGVNIRESGLYPHC
jgi:hypothetical protein